MARRSVALIVNLAVLVLTVGVQPASAQGDKAPIRFLVGVQAGASTDLVARLLADKMQKLLDESVIVDNKPGAAQRIALGELKKAPPDGRTIMLSGSAAFSILPHIYGDTLGYDPTNDFTPISRAVIFQVGFATGPQTGAKNMQEFLAWARKQPNGVTFGTPGAGSSSHFAGLMFGKSTHLQMTHAPYRGGAPALNDLMGSHIPLVVTALSDLPNLHKSGQLTIIASAGPHRSPAAPDVPTLKELGIDVSFESAFDVHTSAHVPPNIVKRLNDAVVQALAMPDVRARIESIGLQIAGTTPEELASKQAAEIKLWAEPVQESGFKGD